MTQEWHFEFFDRQGSHDKFMGSTELVPANDLLDEKDDSLTVPIPFFHDGSTGSLFVRNCRTFWNLCDFRKLDRLDIHLTQVDSGLHFGNPSLYKLIKITIYYLLRILLKHYLQLSVQGNAR